MVDVDLVMIDREFDSEAVKDTCEESGVRYVNPTRIFTNSDETETIAWMYRNGKRFHVTEVESDDGRPTRKQIYLPRESNSDDEDDDDGLSEAWEELCGDWEFEDVEDEPSERCRSRGCSVTSAAKRRSKTASRRRRTERWTLLEPWYSRRATPT